MLEVVFKDVLGEVVLPAGRRGRGRPGYPVSSMVKAFILMFIRGLSSERALERYLVDHPEEASLCGFKDVPWHSTFSRFRRRMGEHFFQGLFRRVRAVLDVDLPYKVVIVGSTPIPKPNDPEAEVGFYTGEPLKGLRYTWLPVSMVYRGPPWSLLGTATTAPPCPNSSRTWDPSTPL